MNKIKSGVGIVFVAAIILGIAQIAYAAQCGRKSGSQQEASCSSCKAAGDCDIRYAYSDANRSQAANVLCPCGQEQEGCKDGTTKINRVYYKKRTCACKILSYGAFCNDCSTVNDGDALNVLETVTSNTDCAG